MNDLIFFVAICLTIVYIWLGDDEDSVQSEFHSKTRYKITEELEREIKFDKRYY